MTRASPRRVEARFAVLPEDVQQELTPLRHVLGSRMLLSDPPRHTRLRNLMTKAFSARVTETKQEVNHEDTKSRKEGREMERSSFLFFPLCSPCLRGSLPLHILFTNILHLRGYSRVS